MIVWLGVIFIILSDGNIFTDSSIFGTEKACREEISRLEKVVSANTELVTSYHISCNPAEFKAVVSKKSQI